MGNETSHLLYPPNELCDSEAPIPELIPSEVESISLEGRFLFVERVVQKTSPPPPPSYKLVGFCTLDVRGDEAFLSEFTILSPYKGKGLSRSFLKMLEDWGNKRGILHIWPKSPTEESLEWVRLLMLSSSRAMVAWLLLHDSVSNSPSFPFSPRPASNLEALASFSSPEALSRVARENQWDITQFIKAFSTFLVKNCSFDQDHALACGLLLGGSTFEGGADPGEEEEEEEGEKESVEEKEEIEDDGIREDIGKLKRDKDKGGSTPLPGNDSLEAPAWKEAAISQETEGPALKKAKSTAE